MNNFDTWVKNRMHFSDDDKLQCIKLTHVILEIAINVRQNGLLWVDDNISAFQDEFLKKALTLAVQPFSTTGMIDSSIEVPKLKMILQKEIMEKDSKGQELLSHLLITEGISGILHGNSLIHIAVNLATYFGENYFTD